MAKASSISSLRSVRSDDRFATTFSLSSIVSLNSSIAMSSNSILASFWSILSFRSSSPSKVELLSSSDSILSSMSSTAADKSPTVEFNPYWQITETKSENREITHRVSRKQNPEKFLKSWFGNVTGRDLRKQNPGKNTEYLVIIFFFEILGMSPSVFYGNKIQTIISGNGIYLEEYH